MGIRTPWSDQIEDRVREAIRDSEITPYRVAELAGIPKTTFNRRMDGVDPWSTPQIEAVARAIGVDPSILIPAPGEWQGAS